MSIIRKIKFKRTANNLDDIVSSTSLDAGEPLLISPTGSDQSYLFIGPANQLDTATDIESVPVFKAQKLDLIDKGIFYSEEMPISSAEDVYLIDDHAGIKTPYTTTNNVKDSNGMSLTEILQSITDRLDALEP